MITGNFIAAGTRVPVSDLVLKDRLWFYKDSVEPFTGVAFLISEVSGTIVKVLVDDMSPVEYDQPMFLVDPN